MFLHSGCIGVARFLRGYYECERYPRPHGVILSTSRRKTTISEFSAPFGAKPLFAAVYLITRWRTEPLIRTAPCPGQASWDSIRRAHYACAEMVAGTDAGVLFRIAAEVR